LWRHGRQRRRCHAHTTGQQRLRRETNKRIEKSLASSQPR
jgi:hypothetical protein